MRSPAVQIRSFTATGTPASGPQSSPAARRASMRVGLRAGAVGIERAEGVQVGVEQGDALQRRLGDGGRAPAARPNGGGQGAEVERQRRMRLVACFHVSHSASSLSSSG